MLLTIKLRNVLPQDTKQIKSINRFKAARSTHRKKIHRILNRKGQMNFLTK